ncbi:MAG: hypothetical protein QOJ37_2540, partial [Pseudonocardiales bacterium]|nr:hypothetical protein [Pseudonocardiales bacterium]
TAAFNAVVSSLASVCPLPTLSPTFTSTDFTVPLAEKEGVSFSDDVMVPDDWMVWVTDAAATVATRRPGPELLVAAMPTALPPATTAMPTAIATVRLRRARRRRAR